MSALKRFAAAVLVTIVVLAGAVVPAAAGRGGHGGHGGSHHHGHHRGRVFIGGFGVDPWWWWWPPYYYNPYYWPYDWPYDWPPVVVTQPPVYVQQSAPAAESFWYYCPSAKGYYPSVPTCPEEWVKVPPRSE